MFNTNEANRRSSLSYTLVAASYVPSKVSSMLANVCLELHYAFVVLNYAKYIA